MYESWRQPWEHYGALVQAVALALEGGLSASNDAIVTAATAAFRGEGEHFDPVAALVAPLLMDRSRGERRVAASVLVAHGIPEGRARVITGARGQLPISAIGEGAPPEIAFDELVGSVGPGKRVQRDVRPAQRWLWTGALSMSAVAVLVVGGLDWRAHHHRRSGSGSYLLWSQQLPQPWVLVSAQATGPIPMRIHGPLVQTFSSGYSISVQITIGDEVQQFVEPELGLITDHSAHMADEAWFAAAHAQVSDMGEERVKAHWREQGHNVFMESRGLSVEQVHGVAAGFVPKPDFIRAGYASPDPSWQESHQGGPPIAPTTDRRGVTMLVFGSTEHPQEFVTVRAVPVSLTEHSEQVPIASGEPFPLRKGITARVRVRPTSAMVWFDPKAGVVVNMMSNDSAAVTPLKELAKSLLMGDATQWVAEAKPFRHSLAGGTPTDRFTLGPLPVIIHANRMASGVVCVLKVCTVTDISSPGAESADFILGGHWWHLDHTPSTLPAPTWRAAPAAALTPSYESVRQAYTWRALDLGTAGRALRRGDDDFAFTRPLG